MAMAMSIYRTLCVLVYIRSSWFSFSAELYGFQVRPVGEVEHRENLLDFVNWATGTSSAQATGDSTAETNGSSTAERARGSNSSCRSPDGSESGKDIINMESNQITLGGEVGNSGETERQDEREVCFLLRVLRDQFDNLMITRFMFLSGLQTQMQT